MAMKLDDLQKGEYFAEGPAGGIYSFNAGSVIPKIAGTTGNVTAPSQVSGLGEKLYQTPEQAAYTQSVAQNVQRAALAGPTASRLYGTRPAATPQSSDLTELDAGGLQAIARQRALEQLGTSPAMAMMYRTAAQNSPQERQVRATEAGIYNDLAKQKAEQMALKMQGLRYVKPAEIKAESDKYGAEQRYKSKAEELAFKDKWKTAEPKDKMALVTETYRLRGVELDKVGELALAKVAAEADADTALDAAKFLHEDAMQAKDLASKRELAQLQRDADLEKGDIAHARAMIALDKSLASQEKQKTLLPGMDVASPAEPKASPEVTKITNDLQEVWAMMNNPPPEGVADPASYKVAVRAKYDDLKERLKLQREHEKLIAK